MPKSKTPPLPKPLPCPFCGGKTEFRFTSEAEAKPEIPAAYWSIMCASKECSVAPPIAFGDTKGAAIEQWNTRAVTPELLLVRRIKGCLMDYRNALLRREHGGMARDRFVKAVEHILGGGK